MSDKSSTQSRSAAWLFAAMLAAACGPDSGADSEAPIPEVQVSARAAIQPNGHDPKLCLRCAEARDSCQDGCGTSQRCLNTCEIAYQSCRSSHNCDWLSDGCESCITNAVSCDTTCQDQLDQCQAGGGRGCITLSTNCRASCDDFFDVCWAAERCEPYTDVTATCNYLDGSGRDFAPFQTSKFSVLAPGVAVLDDIHKLELGLDLPAQKCRTAGVGPCTDKDYSNDWTVDAITMSVRGVPLFVDEKSASEPHLKRMTGGRGDTGISGWTGAELRSNPAWGLAESEITRFLTSIPVVEGAQVPPASSIFASVPTTVQAADLAKLLESQVGAEMADYRKDGRANEGLGCKDLTFCDNRKVLAVELRNRNCDFGNCPPHGDLSASPGVELRGIPDGAGGFSGTLVSVDVEVVVGIDDPTDCLPGDGILCGVGDPKGTSYQELGALDLRMAITPSCVWSGDEPCMTSSDCDDGRTCRVPPGTTQSVCQSADLQLDISPLAPIPEGGLIGAAYHVSDTVAEVLGFGTFPDRVLRRRLNKFALPQSDPLLENLTSCSTSLVSFQADGSIALNLPSSGAVRAVSTPQLVRWARISAAPGPARKLIEVLTNTDIEMANPSTPITENLTFSVSGPPAPDAKQSFAAISDAFAKVCALTAYTPAEGAVPDQFVCRPSLPLDQVHLPPPRVDLPQALADCNGKIPVGANAANDAACEAVAQVKAFFMQPDIWQSCVLSQYGLPSNPNLAMQSVWQRYVEAYDVCSAAAVPLEQVLPVPSVELEITTGRFGASDTFPFADITDREALTQDDHRETKCRNRIQFSLDPEVVGYNLCNGDPDDPATFGQPGCKCADIQPTNPFISYRIDGGYPDGAGSHLAHGLQGVGQYCQDDGSDQYVCGRVRLQDDWPLCQRCGADTNIGCDCTGDPQCEGLEPGLRCVGSASDGWPVGSVGTCLPDPGEIDGQEALEETPWFCLDNCDAIDGVNGSYGVCYYNQEAPNITGYQSTHGVCISANNWCSPTVGCHVLDRMMCKDASPVDVCEAECTSTSDCGPLGFPAHFVCDADFASNNGPGHCVPHQCAVGGLSPGFCNMYR